MITTFLFETDNVEKDSYLWNMLGSILMAFQSVIMLMLITRTLGLLDAGIFTIAYANANLFLTIGKYGMRNFQVSDGRGQFSFAVYKRSRLMTTAALLLVSLLYILYAGWKNTYTLEKSLVIFWMCCFKAVDSIEDVYHGAYQQRGRLDIAAKALTIRMALTIGVFSVCLFLLKNLLFSVILTTIFTGVLLYVFIRMTEARRQEKDTNGDKGRLGLLLKLCFPLFAGTFLSFYIGNAPKYAIDAVLTDELQACYGFIAMPVFVIGLLNGFIFNPLIHKMTVWWNEKKYRAFCRMVFRQVLIVSGITLACILAAAIAGVPVLSWLYHTDLAPYRRELLILLLGGGFLGLTGFLCAVLTIIRFQKCVIWGYGFVAGVAFLASGKAVEAYGIYGAAVLYTVLMGLLSVCFAVFLFCGMKIRMRG